MFVGLHCGIAWMPGLFSLEGAVSVTVPGTWNLLQYQVPGTPNQQVPCYPGTRYHAPQRGETMAGSPSTHMVYRMIYSSIAYDKYWYCTREPPGTGGQ